MDKVLLYPMLLFLLMSAAYADVPPYGGGGSNRLTTAVALVVLLVYVPSLAGLYFLLRTGAAVHRKLAKALSILVFLWAGFAYIFISPGIGFSLAIVGLIGLVLGRAAVAVLGKRGETIRHRRVFFAFLLILVLLSQMMLSGSLS